MTTISVGQNLSSTTSRTTHAIHESESRSVVSDSLPPHGLYSPWNSPGQNTGVGSQPFLQGIFPTQGSNPGVPHCKMLLYHLSRQGSPRILEWAAYPFSSGIFQLRNQTGVSCITGWFFISWATREAPDFSLNQLLVLPATWTDSVFGLCFVDRGHLFILEGDL